MAFMGGVVVLGGSWWPAVVWAFLVGVLFFKSQWEERHLVDAFPGYREYATAVGRFLPRVSQSRSSGARPPGGVWE
jgi:protein-S-isoprenylcysteine O-methyltransferase Ste14